MKRTFDPNFLNSVSNHPEVKPGLLYTGKVDWGPIITNYNNFAFEFEHGGFVGINVAPGVYEVHTMFTPEGRGPKLRVCVDEALQYMFTKTDCHTLITQLPLENKSAHLLATSVGFKVLFSRDETPFGPADFARYTLEEWVQNSPHLEQEGDRFHKQLEQAKEAIGSKLPTHPHDPAHDRAVGAASLMIKEGNVFKAVDFYNLWARFAGYASIELISFNPTVIDVRDAIVGVKDGYMEVLLCRSQ